MDSGDDDGVGEDYDDDDYDNDLKQDDLGLSEYEWWWRGTMSMPVELGSIELGSMASQAEV